MLVTDKNDPKLAEGQQNKTGQHSVYLVLSDEERAKGFIRPVRQIYIHVGKKIERDEEGRLYGKLISISDSDYPKKEYYIEENGFAGYIKYPSSASPLVGRYITKAEFEAIVNRKTHFGGCGAVTKMGTELAETYAANPKFYGATFCVGCNKHLPVDEFTWEDGEIVGS